MKYETVKYPSNINIIYHAEIIIINFKTGTKLLRGT
jgi:hypothetical protein